MSCTKLILPFLICLAFVSVAGAAVLNWNTTSGDWDVPSNWDGNAVPGASDTASVTNGGDVTISTAAAATEALIGVGGNGTGQLASSGSLAAGTFKVGSAGYTGGFAQQGGSVTLSGTGVFEVNNATYTMDNGAITLPSTMVSTGLLVTNGGTFVQNGGTINANVAQANRGMTVGDVASTSSTYQITGGSLVSLGGLNVGNAAGATGTVRISDGLIKPNGNFVVSNNATSVASVYQSGGLIVDPNTVTVGGKGRGYYEMTAGSLHIGGQFTGGTDTAAASYSTVHQSGGTITAVTGMYLSRRPLSTSVYTLDGPGTLNVAWNAFQQLVAGRGGNGTINQSDGVVNTSAMFLTQDSGATGTYNLSGGTLRVQRGIMNNTTSGATTAAFNFTGGALIFESGVPGTTNSPTFLGPAALVNDGGVLHITPGDANNHVTWENKKLSTLCLSQQDYSVYYACNFIQNDGLWELDIMGDLDFDTIAAKNGHGEMKGGEIQINLLGGYTPANNTSYHIVTGTSAASVTPGSVTLPENWQLAAVDNDVVLTYIPEPATMSLLCLGGLAMLRRRK